MKTWPIYLMLQNQFAYGDSHSAPSPSTQIQNEEAARWFDLLMANPGRIGNLGRRPERALLIGPGGPYEVQSLGPHLPNPLTILTSHEPEVEVFRASGMDIYREVGDMHDMPMASGHYDIVFSSNVLEHALAPYCALMEARRVATPGGIGYFILPAFEGDEGGVGPFHLHCLDERVWRELLRKTGWTVADAFFQPGVQPHATKGYTHYRCVASSPPEPHDRVLKELITFKATNP
jgi:SAM-dependent methyltransferase